MNEATEALNSGIPPTEYNEWLSISMAYKAAGGDYSSWLEWCKRGANPISEAEAPAKWASFKTDGAGITAATLFDWARKNGWQASTAPKNTIQRQTDSTPTAKKAENEADREAARATIARSIRDQADRERAYTYLETRGISRATAERYQIGFLSGRNEVIFPYIDTDYYAARNIAIEPNTKPEKGQGLRWRLPAGLPKQPYNLGELNRGAGDIFLAEGQIDVLSLADLGYRAITAKDSEAILAKAAKATGTAFRFIIIPDNDDQGDQYAEKLYKALTAEGQTAYLARIPANYHDANDYLTKNREGLAEWMQTAADHAENEAREAYDLKSAAANIDGWAASWESGTDNPISTGLFPLDDLLDGGLFPGLYVLGALSSLGKTSLVLQIADHVAKSKDVLYVALEQSAAELTAKTLSRLTADLSQMNGNEYKDALTARSITSKAKRARAGRDQLQNLAEAVKLYREGIGKNIFFLDAMSETRPIGTADILNRLQEHKNGRGEYPLLVVDYMQILAPADSRATDKQNADRNIVELKKMARGLNIPIIGVSSFNRANYYNRLSMEAYKESGAIEYTADVVLGIEPRGMKEAKSDKETAANRQLVEDCKNSVIRELEIAVLKNRHGRTGRAGIRYNAMYNTFEAGEKEPDISKIMRI